MTPPGPIAHAVAESDVEDLALQHFAGLGYAVINGPKIEPMSRGAMSRPIFRTSITVSPTPAQAAIRIGASTNPWSAALPSRLESTCRSRPASPRPGSDTPGSSTKW